MEKTQPEGKNLPEKTGSLVRRDEEPNSGVADANLAVPDRDADTDMDVTPEDQEDEKKEKELQIDPDLHCSLQKICEDIDNFLSDSGDREDDAMVEIPQFIDKFLNLMDAKIEKYDNADSRPKGCLVPEDELSFLEAVNRMSKLNNALRDMKSESDQSSLINCIGSTQQRALSYLEEEFRFLLEESRISSSGFVVGDPKADRCILSESESTGSDQDVHFQGYPKEIISYLSKIANEMIAGGYESECCQVYIVARRNIFEESLGKLGFEKHSIDDVQKMNWDLMEREIATWIKTFKQCATVLLSGEKDLAGAVFSAHTSISASLFSNLTRGLVIQLLNFSEGVAMTKRSAEKLFKLLDMYEALRDMVPKIEGLFPDECANELKTETTTVRCRLGEAAIFIFCDLENSIKADTGKTPVPGGAVHPLTRYTMNYLKYACEYNNTLEQIFKEYSKIERADSTSRPRFEGESPAAEQNYSGKETQSPFSVQLMRVMELLDSNLESKAKLYRDVSLSSIFMMNNGRYILQKIKGSAEINQLVDDTWYRKRSSDLRQYHKNYQRETWSRLLGCLNHEGLTVNGKLVKPVLKERFKSFNALFEEIHKTQSCWIISDEQLQSELRVSISAVMIPAYRSFLGRFSQYLDAGRQTEKYVKFQPEDIETYIDDLFDGNPTSMARRR